MGISGGLNREIQNDPIFGTTLHSSSQKKIFFHHYYHNVCDIWVYIYFYWDVKHTRTNICWLFFHCHFSTGRMWVRWHWRGGAADKNNIWEVLPPPKAGSTNSCVHSSWKQRTPSYLWKHLLLQRHCTFKIPRCKRPRRAWQQLWDLHQTFAICQCWQRLS